MSELQQKGRRVLIIGADGLRPDLIDPAIMKHTTITIPPTEYENLTLCVAIPELTDVRVFSDKLHTIGEPWAGIFQGWDGEYIPSDPTPTPGSKMTFTPAEFVLGDSRAWFFGRMWE